MFRLWQSTAFRITLGYTLVFLLSFQVLLGFLWWRTAATLDREIEAVMAADAQAVIDLYDTSGLRSAVVAIKERLDVAGDRLALYGLADRDLDPIVGNLTRWPQGVGAEPGTYEITLPTPLGDRTARILHLRLGGGYHLLVGRDIQDRLALRRLIYDGLIWSAVLAVGLAAAGGLLMRLAVFRRVDAITRTTAAIVHGDLSQRLPTRRAADEFDQLAGTINDMLQQIQVLVGGVQNASNAVAHDLRTPLTELRGRLEGLLRAPRPIADTRAEVAEAVADLDRLIGVFNALLRLAEIDSGTRLAGFRAVDLGAVAAEVAEVYEAVAEDRGLRFAFTPVEGAGEGAGVMVTGDPFLLAQAVGNLVDNAVKFSPPGGRVGLAVSRAADGGGTVTVTDDGPGIPEDEKPHVTERFFRGTATAGTAGTGLGLATVAAVMRLHGGTMDLADNGPGLVVRLGFKAG